MLGQLSPLLVASCWWAPTRNADGCRNLRKRLCVEILPGNCRAASSAGRRWRALSVWGGRGTDGCVPSVAATLRLHQRTPSARERTLLDGNHGNIQLVRPLGGAPCADPDHSRRAAAPVTGSLEMRRPLFLHLGARLEWVSNSPPLAPLWPSVLWHWRLFAVDGWAAGSSRGRWPGLSP